MDRFALTIRRPASGAVCSDLDATESFRLEAVTVLARVALLLRHGAMPLGLEARHHWFSCPGHGQTSFFSKNATIVAFFVNFSLHSRFWRATLCMFRSVGGWRKTRNLTLDERGHR